MQNFIIPYKASQISYVRFGAGSDIVFCFHGYGEDAGHFSFLEDHAADRFTFYAIDLPFHGHTDWNEGLNFTTSDLSQIINLILRHPERSEGQHPAAAEGLPQAQPASSIIGFSLGGRIALSLYEAMPSQINKMILLAPDGLKVNFWYWLSTQTWIGNSLFAFTMKHPQWFFGFLKLLNKLKLVNASIFKFVNYYIGDPDVRRLLYERWTALRKFRPHLGKIKSSIRANKTPFRLIYGKHDRIILASRGEKFRKGIEEYCDLSVISSGHQVLHEKNATEIMQALLH